MDIKILNDFLEVSEKADLTTLDYAKLYRSAGLSVIPIKERGKKPALKSWKKYQTELATEEELQEWFGKDSKLNIAIVTGKISGICAVDLDSPEAVKFSIDNDFADTPIVKTGNGSHLIYDYEDGMANFVKDDVPIPGTDFRAEGGYIVAAPSTHYSGILYEWMETDQDIAVVPKEIRKYAIKSKPTKSYDLTQSPQTDINVLNKGVSEGGRNHSLAKLAGHWLNNNPDLEDCLAKAFAWNKKNTPHLPDSEVRRTVESIYHTHISNHPEDKASDLKTPIPLNDLSNLPAFPVEVFEGISGEFITQVAKVNQVDLAMPSVLYLGVLSTCLAKKAEINLITHTEQLNLYLAAIAGSGERKSGTFKLITKPLYEYQSELKDSMADGIREAKVIIAINDARIKKLKRDYGKADDPTVQMQLRDEFIALQDEIDSNPVPAPPAIITSDITTEALGITMEQNEEKMSIMDPEGGIFDIMSGLYTNQASNIDLYLKAHCGDPISTIRVGRDRVSLDNPALTLGLAVQPCVIQDIGSKKAFHGRGFLARFLYSINKTFVGNRPSQELTITDSLKGSYNDHVKNMAELTCDTMYPDRPEEGNYTVSVTLDTEAKKLFIDYYNKVDKMQRPDGEFEHLLSWSSKLAGQVARMAGLLHFDKHMEKAFDMKIEAATMENAIKLGEYFSEHALATFGLMQEDPGMEAAKKILRNILKNKPKPFKAWELKQALSSLKSTEEVVAGLNVLVDHGFLREKGIPKYSGKGKPPGQIYEVNPKTYK